MSFNCPQWINQQFADPTQLTIYVFDVLPRAIDRTKSHTSLNRKRLYAIPHFWTHDPQGKDREYLGWYDQDGHWLGQTPNTPISPQLTYRGICRSKPTCRRPTWVRARSSVSGQNFRVDLYHHRTLGSIYLVVDLGLADAPGKWYLPSGQEIRVPPSRGWGVITQAEREWDQSIKYVGMC